MNVEGPQEDYLSRGVRSGIALCVFRALTYPTNSPRQGVPELRTSIESSTDVSLLVCELDLAIEGLNAWLQEPANDTSTYWNISALSNVLQPDDRKVPFLRPTRSCDSAGYRLLRGALESMEPLMRYFENTDDAARGLTFGRKAKDAYKAQDAEAMQQALFGGIIQTAGRLLALRLGKDPDMLVPVERGTGNIVLVDLKTVIMDALLEVPLIDELDLNGLSYFSMAKEMEWYKHSPNGPFSKFTSNRAEV